MKCSRLCYSLTHSLRRAAHATAATVAAAAVSSFVPNGFSLMISLTAILLPLLSNLPLCTSILFYTNTRLPAARRRHAAAAVALVRPTTMEKRRKGFEKTHKQASIEYRV